MKTNTFVLVGQFQNWSTAFAVESHAAHYVVDALQTADPDGGWVAITRPITAEEIETTRQLWRDDKIIP